MSKTLSGKWKLRIAFLLLIAAAASPALCHASPPDLTIYFSSDTRGVLRRCGCSEGQMGGLSARAGYIKSNRVKGKTLVLDAGDVFFDGMNVPECRSDFYSLKGHAITDSMREAGYTAAAVGEYDLALGPEFVRRLSGRGGFPFLSANIKTAGEANTVFEAGIVKSVGGIKVAITSVVDDEFPYENFKGQFKGVSISDPATAARDFLRKNSGLGTLRIVLAHLSVKDLHKFSQSVPEADIIIGGHSQEVIEKPERVGNTLIVKGFYKGKRIGRLDLWLNFDKKGRLRQKRVKDLSYQAISLDESLPPDPAVENIITGYRNTLRAKDYNAACEVAQGNSSYIGAAKCRGCHEKEYTNWSSTAHARAFFSIVKTSDQYDPECLSCHTTGYGFTSGYRPGVSEMKNVGCEDCHGAGSGHAEARAAGRQENDIVSGKVGEKVCLGCHDDYNSPNFEYNRYKDMGGAHRGASLKSQ